MYTKGNNKQILKALIVEDSPDDAEILVNELEKGEFLCYWKRVADPESLINILKKEEWNIIFCDYNIPGFSGHEAIEIIKEINPDIPVILISGTVGEDVAVEAIRAGADDYLLKSNFIRLIHVVKRDLAEYKKKRELNKIQKELELQSHLNRVILDHVPATMMLIKKGTYKIITGNNKALQRG